MASRARRHSVRDMERTLDSILYIETDIPPRMTCAEYRRTLAEAARRRSLRYRLRLRPRHAV